MAGGRQGRSRAAQNRYDRASKRVQKSQNRDDSTRDKARRTDPLDQKAYERSIGRTVNPGSNPGEKTTNRYNRVATINNEMNADTRKADLRKQMAGKAEAGRKVRDRRAAARKAARTRKARGGGRSRRTR